MLLINKLVILLLMIFYSIIAMFQSCHASGSNIALGKGYTLTPKPNYALSAPATDTTSLTDGSYSTGYFWTQKSTVGWQQAGNIEILLDLEQVRVIDGVSMNTARGAGAGVHYPSRASVYIGPDLQTLHHAGNLAATADNAAGTYQVRKFSLGGLGIKGRYVLLVIEPKGAFFFCDEIEVYEGNTIRVAATPKTVEEIRGSVILGKQLQNERRILVNQLDRLKSSFGREQAYSRQAEDIRARLEKASGLNDISAAENAFYQLRRDLVRSLNPGTELLVSPVTPWGDFSPAASPSTASLSPLEMTLPLGGQGHAALLVTNLHGNTRRIQLSPVSNKSSAPEISLFHAPFIKTAAFDYVPDPLVSAVGGFTLRPGESRLVFLTATGRTPGRWDAALNISAGAGATTVRLTTNVVNVRLPEKSSLNSVNWSYLDFPLIRNLQAEAVNDLFRHRTNVIVVPPAHIPALPSPKPEEFIRLEKYLAAHRGAGKILLFTNFNTNSAGSSSSAERFMTVSWQNSFKKWYYDVLKSAASAGFSKEQIYLYPFDEMKGDTIRSFISLSTWARKEIPAIRFYATINNAEALRTVEHLDIAQLCDCPELLAGLPGSGAEIWIYDSLYSVPSKSLSPYSYYRLKAWRAFLMGYRGIGFWAYADSGFDRSRANAWDDFDGKYPDYAVIYRGDDNSIISSRRWEAWRMGLEDYELLTMYARKAGDAAARGLARHVLEKQDDTTRADTVRRQMLETLSR